MTIDTTRSAGVVLAEYVTAVRATDAYEAARSKFGQTGMDVISDEIARMLAAVGHVDGEPREPMHGPLYWTLPDGDEVYGCGTWTGKDGDTDRKPIWQFLFIEKTDASHQGYNVHHSLDPNGSGSVWLGVCNNSARLDTNGADAWALWHARRTVAVSPPPNPLANLKAVLAEAALAETAAAPVDDTPTLIGYLRRWQKANPRYFMAAADHRFGCTGAECVTFHALDGLEQFETLDARWATLRREHVDPDGQPSEDQIRRVMALAGQLL